MPASAELLAARVVRVAQRAGATIRTEFAVEASAVHHPAGLGRHPIAVPLLRLRSDDQLLAQFRAGHDEAFDVLHDRYRQRLFAYVRQMLSAGTRQDAEDVLQDVFVRAYGALRADAREMNVRAWLYRVAHNRCIDHLRRPVPPPAEVFEVSRKPLHDPVEEAQRREDLTRLVEDISRLPEQQRSALLMRELDGMSYADLASALDVTVPAVKSLLVRARVGLVDAADAREAACDDIRDDLLATYDRGVKASGRARRHMRTCDSCSEYRVALRGMRQSFASLSPVGLGPLAFGAKLLGLGGAGGGAAAGGTAAAGGGAASSALVAGGSVTACKVAAVVCTAALAGSAVEAKHMVREHQRPAPAAAIHAPARAHAVAPTRPAIASPVNELVPPRALPHGSLTPPAERPASAEVAPVVAAPVVEPEDSVTIGSGDAVSDPDGTAAPGAGGTVAPDSSGDATTSDPAPTAADEPGTSDTDTTAPTPSDSGATEPDTTTDPATPPAQPGDPAGGGASGGATSQPTH
jgi:RNA polymerase sigma factor (sigma-70 family)